MVRASDWSAKVKDVESPWYKHPLAKQEVTGSNPGQPNTKGLKNIFKSEQKVLSLYLDICKQLNFQVFLDKDDKPLAPSHNLCTLFVKSRGCSPRCDGLSFTAEGLFWAHSNWCQALL